MPGYRTRAKYSTKTDVDRRYPVTCARENHQLYIMPSKRKNKTGKKIENKNTNKYQHQQSLLITYDFRTDLYLDTDLSGSCIVFTPNSSAVLRVGITSNSTVFLCEI